VLEYGGAEIQVLDLPGIIEGASEGKGRGRQVISAAKVWILHISVANATEHGLDKRFNPNDPRRHKASGTASIARTRTRICWHKA